MAQKVVKATVDASKRTVMLAGAPGLPSGVTFRVKNGDTLHWEFEALPAGARPRVSFVSGPGGAGLLTKGNVLEASGATVTGGPVNAAASVGKYNYRVELVGPDGTATEMKCLWADGSPLDMGGGEKSPEP